MSPSVSAPEIEINVQLQTVRYGGNFRLRGGVGALVIAVFIDIFSWRHFVILYPARLWTNIDYFQVLRIYCLGQVK